MAWINGKSGTYNISTENSVISGYVKWEEQYDEAANKSLVTQTAYLRRTNIYAGDTFFASAVVTRTAFFDSATVGSTETTGMRLPGNTNPGGGTYTQVYTAKKEIAHNADGTKNVTLGFSMSNSETGVAARSFTVPKTTATVTLTPIPRVSTISKVSGTTLGGQMTVTIAKPVSTFTHQLWYKVGNSAWVDLGEFSETTKTFSLAANLAEYFPNSPTGILQLCLRTFNGNIVVDADYYQDVTVNPPAYAPSITAIDFEAVYPLNNTYLVQGKSRLSVDVKAQSSYGATIKKITAKIDGKIYEDFGFISDILTTPGVHKIEVTATDTRDKSATGYSREFTVYEYKAPTITELTFERQADGTTVVATVKGSISPINNANANTATFSLPGSAEGTISAASGYSINKSVTFTGVPTDYAVTGAATIQDSYTGATTSRVLRTVEVTMDFHSSGKGVAFGKVAELENTLDVAWKIKNNSVPTLLGGMGEVISANSDINTAAFLAPGNYVCSLNDTAKLLKNAPTSVAFKMSVSNCLDSLTDIQSGSWIYLVREIIDYNAQVYTQYVRKEGGNWVYSAWRTSLDTANCPDYVIERGTYDGWEYTKWNSGKMELFAEKSLSFPEGAKQGDFPLYRSIVPLNLSGLFTKIMSGTCCIQINGMVPQVCRHSVNLSTAEIVIVTSRTFSAFTITAPVYIVGKWK